MSSIRLTLLACAVMAVPPAASAANYRHPYTNVDPRNDAGNDTGDRVTDQLNAMQLQLPTARRYPAPVYPGYIQAVPPPRYYTPPPGYMVGPAYPAYGYGW